MRQPPQWMVTNDAVARAFDAVADLLASHGANPFRVRAYHHAAATVRGLPRPVREIVAAEGVEGLQRLPAIGQSLAHAIDQMVRTGRLPLLERMVGRSEAEHLFATVANVGPELARRIHEQLGIETLAELQAAASDGRLSHVAGFGPKRIQAVRESLAGRFARTGAHPVAAPHSSVEDEVAKVAVEHHVPVEEILDIDREYRDQAQHGKLPRIAPRRFNPTAEAWLPVLHTQRGDRHYTALYSNTARAHDMGTTHDWVVIYRDDHDGAGRWTVITSAFGKQRGQRVVRGREQECAAYYEARSLPLFQSSHKDYAI